MRTIALALVLVLVLGAATGCCKKHHSGSVEFVPGKGWVPN
jgi:hypothetical protein